MRIGYSRSFVVLAVIVWKFALLFFAALPVPSNDSFFYDGAVVNYLRHGLYANPSLALALPISGAEVFSAYPPLYQFTLLGWCMVFGTSALAAMWFHFVLFAVYALLVFVTVAALEQLSVRSGSGHAPFPRASAFHIAGLFLFAITFHDRPDSLAHVLGVGAVYALVRALQIPLAPRSQLRWAWLSAGCCVLTFCTGLQLGAFYTAIVLLGLFGSVLAKRMAVPWGPAALMLIGPPTLASGVVFLLPHAWAGFLEHARQTPALTGFRFPAVDELLKIGRAAPAVFFVAVASLLAMRYARQQSQALWIVLASCSIPSLGLLLASAFVMTPNAASFAAYLQPVIAAAFIMLSRQAQPGMSRVAVPALALLACFASIRALGLSTWGIACSVDVGYPSAMRRVNAELNSSMLGSPVVLSSAYLYTAAQNNHVQWVHCDWLKPPGNTQEASDWEGLINLKPEKLILTQFDYYRRYETLVNRLQARPDLATIQVSNTARVPPPDSIRPIRRVVQHLSWAPVIVRIHWSAKAAE